MVRLWDRFPSVANLNEVDSENPLRRAYSENNLDQNNRNLPNQPLLSLSTNRANLGEKLVITWRLTSAPCATDRLALYYDGKCVML